MKKTARKPVHQQEPSYRQDPSWPLLRPDKPDQPWTSWWRWTESTCSTLDRRSRTLGPSRRGSRAGPAELALPRCFSGSRPSDKTFFLSGPFPGFLLWYLVVIFKRNRVHIPHLQHQHCSHFLQSYSEVWTHKKCEFNWKEISQEKSLRALGFEPSALRLGSLLCLSLAFWNYSLCFSIILLIGSHWPLGAIYQAQ